MNYAAIKPHDTANGYGIRVSLFVSGCTHHCKECFNPETWNFNYGKIYSQETENEIINLLSREYIQGLSLLGGEPMEIVNQRTLVHLLRRVKSEYPNKNIWCYSGYTLDKDLIPKGKAFCEVTNEILSYLDVLVDGEFISQLKNLNLRFRGSENQRLIDMKKSFVNNMVQNIILLE